MPMAKVGIKLSLCQKRILVSLQAPERNHPVNKQTPVNILL